MLEQEPDTERSEILDNPRIQREEALLRPEPVKKGKFGLILKIILVLVVLFFIFYLFINPDMLRNPVNEFFGKFG